MSRSCFRLRALWPAAALVCLAGAQVPPALAQDPRLLLPAAPVEDRALEGPDRGDQDPGQTALVELDLYGAGLELQTLPGLAVAAELRRDGQVVDSAATAADNQGLARLTWGNYLLGDGRAAVTIGGMVSQIRPGDQLKVQRRGLPTLQLEIPLLSAAPDPVLDRIEGRAPAGSSLGLSLGSGSAARSFTVEADAAGRFRLDLAGQVDLPEEGLRGSLSWQSAEGLRVHLALAGREVEAVLAAEQLRGRALPGQQVLARLQRDGQTERRFGPGQVDAAGDWSLPLGGPPQGPVRDPGLPQPAWKLSPGDRLELAFVDAADAVTQTASMTLPMLGLGLEADPPLARGRGPADADLRLRLRAPGGETTAHALGGRTDAAGNLDLDLAAVMGLGPGWSAQLLWSAGPGLRVGATAVLPVQRLDVGGSQVWGLAAPGTVISATLRGPDGLVKGLGRGVADDQGSWRARFAAPGAPGLFFGSLPALPGDEVSLESRAGDPLLLRVPPLDAEADLPADRLTGRSRPGAWVQLQPELPGAMPLRVQADADGAFVFDLAGRLDLRPGLGLRLETWERPGQVFGRQWVALAATLDLGTGGLSGRATPGSRVQAQLVDGAGTVVASLQAQAQDFSGLDLPASLRSSLGLADGRFTAAFRDLAGQEVLPRAGDRLLLSAGDQSLELPIGPLDGTVFVEEDRISGQAAPDQALQLQVRPFGRPTLMLALRAGPDGRFQQDLGGRLDLGYNDAVGLFVDLGGHGLRRSLSVPGLTVDLSRGWIGGAAAPGMALRLRVLRQDKPLHEADLRADPRGAFQQELPPLVELRQGDRVELLGLQPPAELLRLDLPELTVDADMATQRITGRAGAPGELTVMAGSALSEGFSVSQDWPVPAADGAWEARLLPSWTLAPGSQVQARLRLGSGHLVIRRQVLPLLRAEFDGPQACGVAPHRQALSGELLGADGQVLARAAGRTDSQGRFRLSFSDAAGRLLRSRPEQQMRVDIGGQRLTVRLPAMALDPDWEQGILRGRGPAHSLVLLRWPAVRCLEGLAPGGGMAAGILATESDAEGRFATDMPGPLAPGEGFDVGLTLPDGHQVFRQLYRPRLEAFLDTDRVGGLAAGAAELALTLQRGGQELARAQTEADADGRFSAALRDGAGRALRLQAGDRLLLDLAGQREEVALPRLSFDWSRGEPVAGEAPPGAACTLSLRLADGRLLNIPRQADTSGRWRLGAADLPPRRDWELADVVELRVSTTVGEGHLALVETPGFAAPPGGGGGDGKERRLFLPRLGQPAQRP